VVTGPALHCPAALSALMGIFHTGLTGSLDEEPTLSSFTNELKSYKPIWVLVVTSALTLVGTPQSLSAG
jgi:hypothetical protein